jgi:hypothetical protein
MATINEVLGGLQILAKYNGEKHDICAAHDIIYAGAGVEVTPEEAVELDKLGWFFEKEFESWARFV